MLVNSKKMLLSAKAGHYAIPHININNLEWAKYILETCEEQQSPVILGVSEGAIHYMGGVNTVVGLVKGLMEDLEITVDVCLHVDHAKSFDTCKKAIDAGFTSVMIDGSTYPLEENIRLTKEVVEYAHSHDVTVEGEVGVVGEQGSGVADKAKYATVSDCLKFYQETNVDMLAPALGSVHGLYKGEADLDFTRMQEISEQLPIPLVLHGGTGIPDDKIKHAIACGINKINVNTELQVEWHNAIVQYMNQNKSIYDPRKIISSGEEAIKNSVRHIITLFEQK